MSARVDVRIHDGKLSAARFDFEQRELIESTRIIKATRPALRTDARRSSLDNATLGRWRFHPEKSDGSRPARSARMR